MADHRPAEPASPRCGTDVRTWNAIMVSAGFACVMFGFSTGQNFAAPLFGELGAYSLGTLYVVFTFFNFAAPMVLKRLGTARAGLVVGCACYALYLAAFVYALVPVVMACSAVIGVGAAILWTSQGVALLENSTEQNRGRLAGYFWATLMFGNALGNSSASTILRALHSDSTHNSTAGADADDSFRSGWHGPKSIMFLVLAIACACGSLCFLAMRPLPKRPPASAADESLLAHTDAEAERGDHFHPAEGIDLSAEPPSPWARAAATVRLMGQPRMLLLAPLMFYTGMGVSFYAAGFTRQVIDRDMIGYIMTTLCTAEFISALILGRLSDRVGPSVIIVGSGLLQCGALAVTWVASREQGMLLFVTAGLLGVADSGFQTQLYPVIAKHFAEGDTSFACYKFVQSLGASAMFFAAPLFVSSGAKHSTPLQLRAELFTMAGMLLLGLVCFVLLEVRAAREARGRKGIPLVESQPAALA